MEILEEIFAFKPEDERILVWYLPDKRSKWFRSPDNIGDFVENISDEKDVYFSGGLVSADYLADLPNKEFKRCPQSKVSGLVGLWADIDVQAEHRGKDNLPPTKKDARRLINDIPLGPSIIIDSGYGYQCWWLFNEPWIFDDSEQRNEAKKLLADWNYTLQVIADRKGWAVDATHDLSRVMRLPGTYNNKQDESKPVRVIEQVLSRYSADEFEQYLADRDENTLEKSSVDVDDGVSPDIDDLDLNEDAQVPLVKWQALQSAEPKVRESFEHKRDDLNDQSASGYDQSLANFAAQAGWSDQEIANLLIFHRRYHNENLKLRQDYYKRTIKTARKSVAREKSESQLDEVIDRAEEINGEEEVDPEEKEKINKEILNHISNMFGIKIHRFVKYTSDPPQYMIETSKGSVIIGSSQALLRQSNFRAKIIDATNCVIPKFANSQKSGYKWDSIVQALLNACVEESLGDEATDSGIGREWISKYLRERAILADCNEASDRDNPFKTDGNIYIFGCDFRKWLKVNEMEQLSAKKMGTIFRSLGCEPDRVPIDKNGSRTTRSVWQLPEEFARIHRGDGE